MYTVTTDASRCLLAMEEFYDALALDAPVRGGQSMADDLMDLSSDLIRRRSERQEAPDGSTWADNEPRYARRKGYQPVGVLTGEMLSPEQLDGHRSIGPEYAEMKYGRNPSAYQHAKWFHDGTKRQPARPFWDLNDDDIDTLSARVAVHLARALRHSGA